jgi:hypothetical protein
MTVEQRLDEVNRRLARPVMDADERESLETERMALQAHLLREYLWRASWPREMTP